MPRTKNPYPAEFREQMVALVRTGRSVESLAREYEPCAATIHAWVRQAAADDGGDPSGLTSEERDELRHLRIRERLLQPASKAFGIGLEKPLGLRSKGYISERSERHQTEQARCDIAQLLPCVRKILVRALEKKATISAGTDRISSSNRDFNTRVSWVCDQRRDMISMFDWPLN